MDSRIDEKLDHISDKISNIDITLGKQHVILEEHIRRTSNLEDRVTPIEKRVHMIQGAIALLMLLAAIGTGLEFLVRR